MILLKNIKSKTIVDITSVKQHLYISKQHYCSKSHDVLNLKIGDKAALSKRFTENDVKQFAELSLDFNPIHLDKEYAATTRFKKPIIHGLLVSSMLSSTVATKLPGPGSIYVKQELNFLKPAYVGDEIRAEVSVKSIKGKKIEIDAQCIAICQDTGKETVVISGPALIYHPDLKE